MPQFKSWRDYNNFERLVKTEVRYIHDKRIETFLDAVESTSKARRQQLTTGTLLWRAQRGHGWSPMFDDNDEKVGEEPRPHPPGRMIPSRHSAREGRVNPKGIPYLYLSSLRDTAVSEVRPWLGMAVSIAQFRVDRDLSIVNFSSDEPTRFQWFFKEPPAEERDEAVWKCIDHAFSKPVNATDDVADYVPTQIVAEFLKTRGLDGMAYRSAFAGGHNVALFELNSATLVNCSLVEVKQLQLDYREIANPYFIRTTEAPPAKPPSARSED